MKAEVESKLFGVVIPEGVQRSLKEWLGGKAPLLANFYGMPGMGKDHVLQEMVTALDEEEVDHTGIINIPKSPTEKDTRRVMVDIAHWVYSNVVGFDPLTPNTSNSTGLENVFLDIYAKLHDRKKNDIHPVAILINNAHNLSFDDLDLFQSQAVETLANIPGFMIVLTSQEELSWHTWETRQQCIRIKLPVFTREKIFQLTESEPLARRIYELSAGHPKTVLALVDRAKQGEKPLSSATVEDVDSLTEPFFSVLKDEIDANLNFGRRGRWLKEMFYLSSAARGIDANLAEAIASAFKIKVPKITDIALEMSYTGLSTWDYDEKAYIMVPELRERILVFMKHDRRKDFIKALDTLADAFLQRAQFLQNQQDQLLLCRLYFIQARVLEGKERGIENELRRKFAASLEGDEDLQKLATDICNDTNFPYFIAFSS